MINLKAFFEEKELEHQDYEITAPNGEMHFLDNSVVIDHILKANKAEQEKISGVIVKIDFANGDVNHFLEHLAHGLVANY